jgi:hypothetical protein
MWWFILSTEYYQDDKIRGMRWEEHVACIGGRFACVVSVIKSKGKKLLVRPGRR